MDGFEEKKLPDLPGTTEEDLKQNRYHSYFKKTVKEFWEEAEIDHPPKTEEKKLCDHYFTYVKGGVECQKCRMGLMGHLDIKKGKLFFRGQPLLQR